MSFPEICQLAADFHVPGIELRGIGGRMDMPAYCAEQTLTPVRIKKLCSQSHTQLLVAGSSAKLTDASEKDRAELLSLSAWADSLQIPYVRVFGGGVWGKPLADADFARAVEFVQWWRKEKETHLWQVELLLETHDAFSGSGPCLKLNQLLPKPLNLIWDSHHTWRLAGESPEFSWNQLAPLIRHVHVKDSVDRPSARHPFTYVLPGEGQMPLRELMTLLQRRSFKGFVSLEWERLWHPYLPPLRAALARMQERMWFTAIPAEPVTTLGEAVGATRLT